MIKLLEKIYQENKDCIITFEKVIITVFSLVYIFLFVIILLQKSTLKKYINLFNHTQNNYLPNISFVSLLKILSLFISSSKL